MRFIGLLVCVAAAYLLAATPLGTTALVVAVANAMVAVGSTAIAVRSDREPPRLLTAMGHVTTALGGFFLFVWFALPKGG